MIEDELREIILKKFKNIKECAKAANMPYTTLDSILKRGVDKANVLNIIRLCGVLGIDTDALADGKIIPKFEQIKADVDGTEFEHIKKYRHLDDHGKEMVDMVLDKEYDRCVNPPQIHTLKVAARGGGVFEVPIDRPFTNEDERELDKIAAESMEENKDL